VSGVSEWGDKGEEERTVAATNTASNALLFFVCEVCSGGVLRLMEGV